MSQNKFFHYLKMIGPGLLFAGAAIGVSHLVQSTKAGAIYGFALTWAVVLSLLSKYPFFEFATRYTAAKGETVLAGYKRMGKWVLPLYLIFTLGTMFTIQAAVTAVTAGLSIYIFGLNTGVVVTSILVLGFCLFILSIGKYSVLDHLIKAVIIILTISTLIAVVFAIGKHEGDIDFTQVLPTQGTGLVFLIALMGWMPAPVDLSVWSSVWAEAKQKNTKEDFNLKTALIDFNVGYWTTLVIAMFFLILGSLVMYGSGEVFSSKAGKFAEQLINMYTSTLGDWSFPLISIAALTTMFSTTLTCMDALPRVMGRATVLTLGDFSEEKDNRAYWIWMMILLLGTMVIISLFMDSIVQLVQVATILSFLTTPFYAVLNYLLVKGKHMPEPARPGFGMLIFSWLSFIFLFGFSVVFIVSLF